MSYQHIFLDWDGTLVDSSEGLYNATVYMLEKIGQGENKSKTNHRLFRISGSAYVKRCIRDNRRKSKKGVCCFSGIHGCKKGLWNIRRMTAPCRCYGI